MSASGTVSLASRSCLTGGGTVDGLMCTAAEIDELGTWKKTGIQAALAREEKQKG